MYGDEDVDPGGAASTCKRASGFLHRNLKERLDLRYTPHLEFILDRSLAQRRPHHAADAHDRRGARAARALTAHGHSQCSTSRRAGRRTTWSRACGVSPARSASATRARSIRWPTGVLPVLLGRATRLADFVQAQPQDIRGAGGAWRRPPSPTTPKARSSPLPPCRRFDRRVEAALPRLRRRHPADAAALLGAESQRPARLRPCPPRRHRRARRRGRSRSTTLRVLALARALDARGRRAARARTFDRWRATSPWRSGRSAT